MSCKKCLALGIDWEDRRSMFCLECGGTGLNWKNREYFCNDTCETKHNSIQNREPWNCPKCGKHCWKRKFCENLVRTCCSCGYKSQ